MAGAQLTKALRWALASKIGTSHIKSGTEKQDWARCVQLESRIGKVTLSIISDGAGSASMGKQGAAIVCYSIIQRFRDYYRSNSVNPSDEELWSWIDGARESINACAIKRKATRRDFSATLVALIITPKDVIVLHIGDGSVVARKTDQQWTALSWPETGEYASTTYFLIDDPSPKLKISRFANEYDGYALFSDGIENLALDFKNHMPHPPFFNSLLRAVDGLPKSGKIESLSKELTNFLGSDKVNERTDDDKSLIIISSK